MCIPQLTNSVAPQCCKQHHQSYLKYLFHKYFQSFPPTAQISPVHLVQAGLFREQSRLLALQTFYLHPPQIIYHTCPVTRSFRCQLINQLVHHRIWWNINTPCYISLMHVNKSKLCFKQKNFINLILYHQNELKFKEKTPLNSIFVRVYI